MTHRCESSGRALHFGWEGTRVKTVATDPVSIGSAPPAPLVWTYHYVEGRLDAACDPRPGPRCWRYEYTGGRLSRIVQPKGNTQVALTYDAAGLVASREDGAGTRLRYEYPPSAEGAPRLVRTLDADDEVMESEYDSANLLVRSTDQAGQTTRFTYDARGQRTGVTDPNGTQVTMTYDSHGNVVAQRDGTGATTWSTYANDLLVARSDPRSAGPGDDRYATRYTYDSFRRLITETGPATAAVPAAVTTWAYSGGALQSDGTRVGTEPAVGGGVVPPSLATSVVDAAGGTVALSYDRAGDVVGLVDAAGLSTTWTYDELGRRRTEIVHDPDFADGAVTSTWRYDHAGDTVEVTGPATTNALGGASSQLRATSAFDANRNRYRVELADLAGGPARVTRFSHDDAERVETMTDPEDATTRRHFDDRGLVDTVTDAEGRSIRTDYDPRGLAIRRTLLGFVDDPVAGSPPRDVVLATTTYDDAGRELTTTDALGRVVRTAWDGADRVRSTTAIGFADPDGTRRDVVLGDTTYDPAGHPLVARSAGGTRTLVNTWDEAGRLVSSVFDPAGLNRTTTYSYDRAGRVLAVRTADATRAETTTSTWDPAGRRLTETLDDGQGGLTTRFGYDRRGHVVAVTDPRGTPAGADAAAYTTEHGYDEAGRAVSVLGPPVPLDGGPALVRPLHLVARNAFGDTTATRDARGSRTTHTYDRTGRLVRIDHPAYTTPAGATLAPNETFRYDRVGNLVSHTDRRNNTTDWDFDAANRPVRQRDPLVAGQAARGVTRWSYDDAGNRTAEVDQEGARVEWTYDDLDRTATETLVIRRPDPQAPLRATTAMRYDDAGHPTAVIDPLLHTTTTAWSPAGEALRSTDATGKLTTTTYDLAGRPLVVTDPLGRATRTTYDPAGRPTTIERLSPAGAVLATTGVGWDRAGNQTSATSPRGFTTTYGVDAGGRTGTVTVASGATTSITTAYGFDAGGLMTSLTDGRHNVTRATYNPWGLPESVIEPATTAHPALADRSFTTTYDAGGLAVGEVRPGGVAIGRVFDELGRLRAENGGGGAASAGRALGWDRAGRLISASHPAGTIALSYDDRDLLTAATGPAGATSAVYDLAGRLRQRSDGAGTADFTWTARGELETASESLTATTATYAYDPAGQLRTVDHTGGARRVLEWDDLGRPAADTLSSATGATVARHAYGFDLDANLTSQSDDLPANGARGTNTYAYDGAGRLSAWTNPSGTTTTYGYDGAGNRDRIGSATLAYDQRNRLMSGPEGTYAYTPRGTLAALTPAPTGLAALTCPLLPSTCPPARPLTHDAFDRLATDATGTTTTSYSYDGLDRVATRNGAGFSYAGTDLDPVNDATATYARLPGGQAVAARVGTNAYRVGTDAHGDLTQLWRPAGGATLAGSRAYDPLGRVTGTVSPSGGMPAAGFQGDYTDPASARVWMGARWYAPSAGTFSARDTWAGVASKPISLNRYTYAFANPRSFFDPDGHTPESVVDDAIGAIGTMAEAIALSGAIFNWAAGVVTAAAQMAASIGAWVYRNSTELGRSFLAGLDIVAADAGRFAVGVAAACGGSPGCTATRLLGAAGGAVRQAAGACWGSTTCRSVVVGATLVAVAIAAPALVPAMLVGAGIGGAVGVATCNGDAGCVATSVLVGTAGGVGGTGFTATRLALSGLSAGGAAQVLDGHLDPARLAFDAGLAVVGGKTLLKLGSVAGQAAIRSSERVKPLASRLLGQGEEGASNLFLFGRGASAPRMAPCNSFVPGTAVLMADGTTKPIEDVELGDLVWAADPETGEEGPREVTRLITGHGDKTLVDIEIDGATVTATDHHPIWVNNQGQWVDADNLEPGDYLLDEHGVTLLIDDVDIRQVSNQTVHNLTVDDLHTFFVLAGDEAILTHNNSCPVGDLLPDEVAQIQRVVDDAGRPLEVVGSAATGSRRGVGSGLPIGKGPGTRSDIDFLIPPSSLDHFRGLTARLPSLDPRSGVIPGIHNPHIGPAIRFEPGGSPFFVPAAL